MDAELAEDVVTMCFDSADGDQQCARYLGIIHAIRQQAQHIALAGRKRLYED